MLNYDFFHNFLFSLQKLYYISWVSAIVRFDLSKTTAFSERRCLAPAHFGTAGVS